MSEALEYRIKRNRQSAIVVIAMVLFGVAVCLWAVAITQPIQSGEWQSLMLVSAFYDVMGFACLAGYRGTSVDGYCRSFFEFVGVSYSDPPLNEWEESLEDRNAFAVDKYEQ